VSLELSRLENIGEPAHHGAYMTWNVAPVRVNERKRQRLARVVRKDLPGLRQHSSLPPHALDGDSFADGVCFEGSSIRDFQEI
jgi:hypothetical protein